VCSTVVRAVSTSWERSRSGRCEYVLGKDIREEQVDMFAMVSNHGPKNRVKDPRELLPAATEMIEERNKEIWRLSSKHPS
jgi:hypothetical protein